MMINIIRIVLSKIAFFVVPKIENNIPAGRMKNVPDAGFLLLSMPGEGEGVSE